MHDLFLAFYLRLDEIYDDMGSLALPLLVTLTAEISDGSSRSSG
jgi:hypothetical protein